MWGKIKDWCQRNKSYLATLFIASLGVGFTLAGICIFFPAAVTAFAGIALLGLTPLAFLNTLPFALAVFALSSIMTGISFGVIAVGIMVMQQLSSIAVNLYELFRGERVQSKETFFESSYDYLNRHLQPEFSESYDDVDDEFDEISSDEMESVIAPQSSAPASHRDEEEPSSTIAFNS